MGGCESTQNSRNRTLMPAIAINEAIGATSQLFGCFDSDDGVTNSHASDIINESEKLKETEEYMQTIEEEWASRQRQLQIQAEEAQRLHEQEKAERRRLLDLQTRKKRRIEEVIKKKEKGFPQPHTLVEATVKPPTSLPEGVKFELHTLPVVPKAVVDGDGVTVYVSTSDPRESSFVPSHVHITAVEISEARARSYAEADALHRQIIDSGYRWIKLQNEEVLARKYRIRLRGIDAPESSMVYGKEAKDELTKIVQGESLRVLVYGEDHYGRHVGDIYCNGIFVQELMLKKGLAWHYAAYDNRVQLERWEKEARAKGVGLWASSNPEKPWEWRKKQQEGSKRRKIVEAPGRNHRIFIDDFKDDPSANFESDFEDDPSTNFEGDFEDDFEDDSTGYPEFEVDLEFDYM